MEGIELWLLALGLAMDCFSVSIASGITLGALRWRHMLTMALSFGLFQALMPMIGWTGASLFSHLIETIDHWIAFGILAFLGGRMIIGNLRGGDNHQAFDPTKFKVVIMLAVATSIDALAVGVSFAFLGATLSSVSYSVAIIGLVSFLMSMLGLVFSIRFGSKIAEKLRAEVWGGAILILIGVKILVEHLFLNN